MKVPMKWLKEYVDINMTAEEYASRMVMTGTAVEGVEKTGEQFDKVVVGYVVSCQDHPNSDHLHICMVDVGEEEPIQIICGAPNVHAGMRVAAALDGARLPGGKILGAGRVGRQNDARLVQQKAPGFRGRDALRTAEQQRAAQLLFQTGNGRAEALLGDEQLACRLGKAPAAAGLVKI